MGGRKPLLAPIALTAVAVGLSACTLLSPGSASQHSLAKVRVLGYSEIGQSDDSGSWGSDSVGAYIGRPAAFGAISRVVTGTGVRVQNVAAGPVDIPVFGAIEIADGTAPIGCKLAVSRFRKDARPFQWFGATSGQLKQVRAGSLNIILIDVTCGSG